MLNVGVGGITTETGAPASIAVTAPVLMTAAQSWNIVDAGTTFTAGGAVSGNVGLLKDGAGALVLGVANSFTGGVTINAGTVQLGDAGSLNSVTPNGVTFGANSTGVLRLNGNNLTLPSLNSDAVVGTPIVQNNSATAATLTLFIASGTSVFGGNIENGVGGGALSVTKTGAKSA